MFNYITLERVIYYSILLLTTKLKRLKRDAPDCVVYIYICYMLRRAFAIVIKKTTQRGDLSEGERDGWSSSLTSLSCVLYALTARWRQAASQSGDALSVEVGDFKKKTQRRVEQKT